MDFHNRAITYIREEFPNKSKIYSDNHLTAIVESSIRTAELYKIKFEADVMRFIDLQWRIAEDFDINFKYPWAKEILNNVRIMPKKKIELLRLAYFNHLNDKITNNE